MGLVLGFLAFSAFGALPRYLSCEDMMEMQGLTFRLMDVADMNDVEAMLPRRTPATHWRAVFVTQRDRHQRTGYVVRDEQGVVAAMTWRIVPTGVELVEFHVASRFHRVAGLEAWLLDKLQKRIGPNKAIRMVLPEMDRRGATNLMGLGFVRRGTNPRAFGPRNRLMVGLIFIYKPELPPEEAAPAFTEEGEPEAVAPTAMPLLGNLQPSELDDFYEFTEVHRGVEARDEVKRLMGRSLPAGQTGTYGLVTRNEQGSITNGIIYYDDRNTRTVYVEYAILPGQDDDVARRLVESLNIGALRTTMFDNLEIDVEKFGGDPDPFLRAGFRAVDGTQGRILRYAVGN